MTTEDSTWNVHTGGIDAIWTHKEFVPKSLSSKSAQVEQRI